MPRSNRIYRSGIENWRILWVTSPGDSTALSQCSYIWPAKLRNLHSQTFILEMLIYAMYSFEFFNTSFIFQVYLYHRTRQCNVTECMLNISHRVSKDLYSEYLNKDDILLRTISSGKRVIESIYIWTLSMNRQKYTYYKGKRVIDVLICRLH